MAKLAIVKTGGKQYLVKENDELVVSNLPGKEKDDVTMETLAVFDENGSSLDLGSPVLTSTVKAQIIEQGKGEKIRVARFKSKVRYRKVTGFRAQLTKLKIVSI